MLKRTKALYDVDALVWWLTNNTLNKNGRDGWRCEFNAAASAACTGTCPVWKASKNSKDSPSLSSRQFCCCCCCDVIAHRGRNMLCTTTTTTTSAVPLPLYGCDVLAVMHQNASHPPIRLGTRPSDRPSVRPFANSDKEQRRFIIICARSIRIRALVD